AGFEGAETGRRIVDRDTAHAGIDDDADALDGERGFGNRSREHDLATASRRGVDGAILLGGGQLTIERRDIDMRWNAVLQTFGDAGDFALPRQEDEDRAFLLAEGREDRAGHLILEPLLRVGREVAGVDREAA